MRNLAFFDQIQRAEIPRRDWTFYAPTFYYDIVTFTAAFLTPIAKVRALLPSPRMQPLRATPWHAVTTITAFEYRDTDVGPYNEVSIAFPFTLDKPAPVLTGLLRQMAEGPMAYVHHLPVTTEIARFGGVEFFNYPKFLASIDFEEEGEWLSCRLAEGDSHILTLTVRQLPTQPSGRSRIHGITVREGRILRSKVILNGRQQAISRNPAHVHLELGDHPIAQELRDLNLGRLNQFQYIPEGQAILTPVLESYAAD